LNRVCSIFSQLLQLFSRVEFESAVRRHRANRHARGFDCWTQFVAMLFCQLGQAQSLREICGGLAASEGKLRHLGVGLAPKRSTLAYANEHRPWQLYQAVFESVLTRTQGLATIYKRRFRFRNPLLSIDSTIIDLSLSVYDWAHYRREKGAAKLHLVLDHQGHLPRFAVVSEGRCCDLSPARSLTFPAGTILVFDRGYQDYRWFDRLDQRGVFYVTRLRRHAHVEVVESFPRPKGAVLCDQRVRLGCQRYRMHTDVRRIVFQDPGMHEPLVFLTNNFKLAASTIAAIYRERWQIEVFFRALKQTLRVKTFVGTSPNAVRIQIWTALIAILLLKLLQLRAQFSWSLANLVALLRQQLFVYRSLWDWIDQPFQPPPALDQTPVQQLSLGIL
jgi:hypothetical protein